MGYKKYRLRSRSHVRWRDFKPDGCSLCVFSLWESSRYKSIISMHAKKYILFINTLNLSTRYTYNIHFVFITHREDAWFLCHQMNFDIFPSANSAESELRCNNITVDIHVKQDCLGKMQNLDALWLVFLTNGRKKSESQSFGHIEFSL